MSQERHKVKVFAEYISAVRAFMDARGIMEVFTNPIMSKRVPDLGVDVIPISLVSRGKCFLHTSPEWEMKKLLSGGSGDIYQLAMVYRDDPLSCWHKPAFLMLEWYQLGIDEQALIQICCELLEFLGCKEKPQHHHLPDLYQKHCGINVHKVGVDELKAYCDVHRIPVSGLERDHEISSWLDLIWLNKIETEFSRGLHIVDRYTVEQSALANVIDEPYPHAQRFEIYLNGCEIANGYHELNDHVQMAERLEALSKRMQLAGESTVDAADIQNMPQCSGVSIGLERLFTLLSSSGLNGFDCFSKV